MSLERYSRYFLVDSQALVRWVTGVLSVVGGVYTLVFVFVLPLYLAAISVLIVCSLMGCYFLARTKYELLVRYGVVFITNLAVLFYACLLGIESGVHLFYYSLVVIPFLLFDLERWRHVFSSVLVTIVCWGLFCFIGQDPFPFTLILSPFSLSLFKWLTGGMNFFIIILGLSFYFFSNEFHKKKITKSNHDLQKAYHDLQKSQSISTELFRQSSYATLTRGIAHEIKNPMQMMYGHAELVLERLGDQDRVRSFADSVVRNLDRLKRLIESMLVYGSSMGKDKGAFSLNQMLSDVVELSKHQCGVKGIKISFISDMDVLILGNKDFLYQAFLNLVVNAIQYTNEGGKIDVSMVSTDYVDKRNVSRNGVEVIVKDTGVGMSEEIVSRIFDPYYTTKNQPENTGLGLSMVMKAVTENDGVVDVDSEAGKGTTFRVSLPVFVG